VFEVRDAFPLLRFELFAQPRTAIYYYSAYPYLRVFYLFICFVRNKRAVKFQRTTKQAGTARLKALIAGLRRNTKTWATHSNITVQSITLKNPHILRVF